MNRPQPFALLVALTVLGSGLLATGDASAGGNSGWGWAKPLNKRMGAFYTSNKNANFSRQRSQPSRGSSYHRRLPSATQYHRAPATYVPQQQLPPVTVPVSPVLVSPAPVSPVPVSHVPVSAVPTPVKPKAPVAIWSAVVQPPQHTPAKPAAAPPQPKPIESLPHRSTTDSFWQ